MPVDKRRLAAMWDDEDDMEEELADFEEDLLDWEVDAEGLDLEDEMDLEEYAAVQKYAEELGLQEQAIAEELDLEDLMDSSDY